MTGGTTSFPTPLPAALQSSPSLLLLLSMAVGAEVSLPTLPFSLLTQPPSSLVPRLSSAIAPVWKQGDGSSVRPWTHTVPALPAAPRGSRHRRRRQTKPNQTKPQPPSPAPACTASGTANPPSAATGRAQLPPGALACPDRAAKGWQHRHGGAGHGRESGGTAGEAAGSRAGRDAQPQQQTHAHAAFKTKANTSLLSGFTVCYPSCLGHAVPPPRCPSSTCPAPERAARPSSLPPAGFGPALPAGVLAPAASPLQRWHVSIIFFLFCFFFFLLSPFHNPSSPAFSAGASGAACGASSQGNWQRARRRDPPAADGAPPGAGSPSASHQPWHGGPGGLGGLPTLGSSSLAPRAPAAAAAPLPKAKWGEEKGKAAERGAGFAVPSGGGPAGGPFPLPPPSGRRPCPSAESAGAWPWCRHRKGRLSPARLRSCPQPSQKSPSQRWHAPTQPSSAMLHGEHGSRGHTSYPASVCRVGGPGKLGRGERRRDFWPWVGGFGVPSGRVSLCTAASASCDTASPPRAEILAQVVRLCHGSVLASHWHCSHPRFSGFSAPNSWSRCLFEGRSRRVA